MKKTTFTLEQIVDRLNMVADFYSNKAASLQEGLPFYSANVEEVLNEAEGYERIADEFYFVARCIERGEVF